MQAVWTILSNRSISKEKTDMSAVIAGTLIAKDARSQTTSADRNTLILHPMPAGTLHRYRMYNTSEKNNQTNT